MLENCNLLPGSLGLREHLEFGGDVLQSYGS